jgi:hypothetical protein
MKRPDRKEALAICKLMIAELGVEWKPDVAPKRSNLKDDWYLPVVKRDGVRIMHYDPDKKEYTAFHSNVNFELESWEGRTPKEALSRLIAAHKNTIKWLKGQREALDERIPKEEEKLKQMLAWIKRAK